MSILDLQLFHSTPVVYRGNSTVVLPFTTYSHHVYPIWIYDRSSDKSQYRFQNKLVILPRDWDVRRPRRHELSTRAPLYRRYFSKASIRRGTDLISRRRQVYWFGITDPPRNVSARRTSNGSRRLFIRRLVPNLYVDFPNTSHQCQIFCFVFEF